LDSYRTQDFDALRRDYDRTAKLMTCKAEIFVENQEMEFIITPLG
jgi:hypothetical protein